jgi:hypothetical protein
MKRISVKPHKDRWWVCVNDTPAGQMYDCFDRGTMRHPWPYKQGNYGHTEKREALEHAEKVVSFFNEVDREKERLVPKSAGKQASPLYWGGATLEIK